jgi:hypothetical protein
MKGCLFYAAIICPLIGLAPLGCAILAYQIAVSLGCRLDEGSVHPCLFMGQDIGGLLYAMGMMGWLMLATIWLLLLAPILWIAYAIVRHRAKQPQGE